MNNIGELSEINELLLKAAEEGDLKAVKQCLKQGASINYTDEKNGNSAISQAATYGHLNIIKFLIEKGADYHMNSEQALMYAAEDGHLNIVKFLIEEKKANYRILNDLCVNYAVNGFSEMDKGNQIGVIKYLASKGANIHKNNDASFKQAVKEDAVGMVACFVELGSNIEYAVKNGGDNTKEWALDWLLKERKKNSLEKMKTIRETADKNINTKMPNKASN